MEFTIYFPITLILCLAFFKKIKVIVGFLIFSLTLQVTSIINVSAINYSLQVYRFLNVVLSVILLLYVIKNGLKLGNLNKIEKLILFYGFALVLYSTYASILFPFIFEGLEIFPPQLGIDYSVVYGPSPLRFSIHNLAFPFFIAFYYLSLVMVISFLRWTEKEVMRIVKAFIISFYLNVVVCISQLMFGLFGTVDITKFLYTIITRDYALSYVPILNIPRLQGTYMEPSMFSSLLLAIYSYYLSKYIVYIKLKYLIMIILSLSLVILSTSTTAILGLFIMTVLVTAYHILQEAKRFYRALYLFLVISILSSSMLIIFYDFVYQVIDFAILSKSGTSSFKNRIVSDIHSIKILFETSFLGVGMGSHRSASLLPHILAQIGIPGTVFFIMFSYYIFKNSLVLRNTKFQHLIFLYPSVIVSQLIAYPDITNPTLWQAIYIVSIASSYVSKSKLQR